jgi:hypothetical protein
MGSQSSPTTQFSVINDVSARPGDGQITSVSLWMLLTDASSSQALRSKMLTLGEWTVR